MDPESFRLTIELLFDDQGEQMTPSDLIIAQNLYQSTGHIPSVFEIQSVQYQDQRRNVNFLQHMIGNNGIHHVGGASINPLMDIVTDDPDDNGTDSGSDSGTESDDVEQPRVPVRGNGNNRTIPREVLQPIQIISNDINSTRNILNRIFELGGITLDTIVDNNNNEMIPRIPTAVKQILRQEEIDKIDLQMITEHHSIEACPICYDKFVKTDLIRILPCSHRFHRMCIDKWLNEESYLCSICNQGAGMYSNINL